jgi:uncharacterized protein (DUF2225 family)
MTTLRKIAYQCPVCTHEFETQKVVATNSYGGQRTDFHERAAGGQPLPHRVHVCWKCGFAGPDAVFEDERPELEPTVIEQLMEEMPKYRARSLTGSEKYEAAAEVAKIMGEEDRLIADYLLSAAWCCVDEEDSEAERYFRIKAAERFETALEAFDQIERDERASIRYLTGEVWRRAGFIDKARRHFDLVPSEIITPQTQQWIANAALQQASAPREWFG